MASEVIPLTDSGVGSAPEQIGGSGVAIPASLIPVRLGNVLKSQRRVLNFVGNVNVYDDPTTKSAVVDIGNTGVNPDDHDSVTVSARRSIIITAEMPVGVVRNLSGTAVTTVSLSAYNADFVQTLPSFPPDGDNDIQFLLAVPDEMLAASNITARLFVVGG